MSSLNTAQPANPKGASSSPVHESTPGFPASGQQQQQSQKQQQPSLQPSAAAVTVTSINANTTAANPANINVATKSIQNILPRVINSSAQKPPVSSVGSVSMVNYQKPNIPAQNNGNKTNIPNGTSPTKSKLPSGDPNASGVSKSTKYRRQKKAAMLKAAISVAANQDPASIYRSKMNLLSEGSSFKNSTSNGTTNKKPTSSDLSRANHQGSNASKNQSQQNADSINATLARRVGEQLQRNSKTYRKLTLLESHVDREIKEAKVKLLETMKAFSAVCAQCPLPATQPMIEKQNETYSLQPNCDVDSMKQDMASSAPPKTPANPNSAPSKAITLSSLMTRLLGDNTYSKFEAMNSSDSYTLRLYIYHAYNGPPMEGGSRPHRDDNGANSSSSSDSSESASADEVGKENSYLPEFVPFWNLHIIGHLLPKLDEDGSETIESQRVREICTLTHFIQRCIVELDSDLYPDDYLIEWDRHVDNHIFDGFEISRRAISESEAFISLKIDHHPRKYRLSSELAGFVGTMTSTLEQVISSCWKYFLDEKIISKRQDNNESLNISRNLQPVSVNDFDVLIKRSGKLGFLLEDIADSMRYRDSDAADKENTAMMEQGSDAADRESKAMKEQGSDEADKENTTMMEQDYNKEEMSVGLLKFFEYIRMHVGPEPDLHIRYPIQLKTMDVTSFCYDIPVDVQYLDGVDFGAADTPRYRVEPSTWFNQDETGIVELNNKHLEALEALAYHKHRREFFQNFGTNPEKMINQLILAGETAPLYWKRHALSEYEINEGFRKEDEGDLSVYYRKNWVDEAAHRYRLKQDIERLTALLENSEEQK